MDPGVESFALAQKEQLKEMEAAEPLQEEEGDDAVLKVEGATHGGHHQCADAGGHCTGGEERLLLLVGAGAELATSGPVEVKFGQTLKVKVSSKILYHICSKCENNPQPGIEVENDTDVEELEVEEGGGQVLPVVA